MAKTVYTSVTNRSGKVVRIAGTLAEDGSQVLVYPAGGTTSFGWYNIERFEGERLTAGTLKKLFTP